MWFKTLDLPNTDSLQHLWLKEMGIKELWLTENNIVHYSNKPNNGILTHIQAHSTTSIKANLKIGFCSKTEEALNQLNHEVENCTACSLYKNRRRAVFGTGTTVGVRWLIVGEAPGGEEDQKGLPFIGKSGRLLDAMLASVGMNREHNVYITNVVKCRPLGNRNPNPEEIFACNRYLDNQIILLRPKQIFALGRFAAQTLLRTNTTLGSLRGRIHMFKDKNDRMIPLVVSYHPAYLLRNPSEKAEAWKDLCLLMKLG